MRFDNAQQNICLSAREMTLIALSHLHHPVDDAPLAADSLLCRQILGEVEPFLLEETISFGEHCFSISATVDKWEKEEITLLFSAEFSPSAPPEEAVKFSRGVGFLTAALLMRKEKLRSITLSIGYYRPSTSELSFCKEHVTFSKAESFLERIMGAVCRFAEEEIDRLSRRLPLFKSAKFPYASARAGQKDLMRSCFSAIRSGKTLFATAPTGTGKTISTLYPAIRAMGCGDCDKVFYLTPKTTSANAAEEALRLFAQNGVPLRGIRISAKEKVCRASHGAGDCRACPRSKRAGGKFLAVAHRLYENGCCLPTEEALFAAAAEENLCPYELSLSCAELSDVVIGDYNYLFDPAVALRRFFETENGSRYCCLVDEAHNLPERGREIFSASLSRIMLTNALPILSEEGQILEKMQVLTEAFASTEIKMLQNELRKDENGDEVGFASQSNLPEKVSEAILALSAALSDRCTSLRSRNDAHAKEMRALAHTYRLLADAVARYDNHFTTYMLREKGETTLTFYCVDPAPFLRERADLVDSVIYFSATLTPLEYYRTVLGGDRASLTAEIPSPFDPERLCITIMDKISTKLSKREETLTKVVKVILETIRGKAGNYMVFCPSFAYMERVSALFRRLLPKIETLVQKRAMSAREREDFLGEFRRERKGYLIGFCVMGGIYAEGIDLAGDSLIGAIVVGIGIPSLSAEREMIQAYYQGISDEGKEFAYLYPGMNRVLQAAGRVIRRAEDRGVLVLIDERFRDPIYRKILPAHWRGLKYAGDLPALSEHIRRFWEAASQEDTPTSYSETQTTPKGETP